MKTLAKNFGVAENANAYDDETAQSKGGRRSNRISRMKLRHGGRMSKMISSTKKHPRQQQPVMETKEHLNPMLNAQSLEMISTAQWTEKVEVNPNQKNQSVVAAHKGSKKTGTASITDGTTSRSRRVSVHLPTSESDSRKSSRKSSAHL
jgi:hypothetical protein